MKSIRLIDLGTVPPVRSQTCYHAAARALGPESPDTIILVRPSAPYVCIGYHQDVDREVDRDYCRASGLPVYRREVGGGAVYLDGDQVFIQWVFHPSSLPAGVEERFALYIRPLVLAYRSLGVEAEHRPINDIQVRGKKIGGTGAARIGNAEVVVGSFIFDFDKAAMARVLKVSSEKMRDKVHQGLRDYMTTLSDELGRPPDRRGMQDLYLDRCGEVLGADIVPGEWTAEEEAAARELDEVFPTREWLEQKGAPRRPGVKIHEDVQIVESILKAPGGLIRATARLRNGRIDDVSFTGDFTIYPRTAVADIERALRGILPDEGAVLERIADRYRALAVRVSRRRAGALGRGRFPRREERHAGPGLTIP